MREWIAGHSIEIFGAVTGIVYVILEIRQNIWLWPLGIVTSAIYLWVFYNSRFYADMGLQGYYLAISIYGWFLWTRKDRIKDQQSTPALPVTRISLRLSVLLTIITALLTLVIWYILSQFTDSPLPGWDAFTTSISIVATWMLARKIIEHWVLWIIADVVSVGLYVYRGLYPTVVLFTVYTVMAAIGYYKWKETLHTKEQRNSINE